ncbi:MAG: hypothetical protein A3I72_10740 [Candidatus Tectomicrobia bacterium RIFCSPLOWO2_02_FULL_70_19]|nr:MAG: hypothetical protein A3I72_10740 [Candidatus Tectomicrobia bacterium RIFCSPLOWO2_02_FULL_70_19]
MAEALQRQGMRKPLSPQDMRREKDAPANGGRIIPEEPIRCNRPLESDGSRKDFQPDRRAFSRLAQH